MPIEQGDLDRLLDQFKDFSKTSNQEMLDKLSAEFQGKLDDLEKRLRAEFMNKFAEMEVQQKAVGQEERGIKFQRTGLTSRRSASADGREPRKHVVLLGFPQELMQPTIKRVAESIRQKIGLTMAQPKIKAFDFSRKAMFVFQTEAQAESFVEKADTQEFPFTCPISGTVVELRLKLHVPSEERTHAKTIGALRNEIIKIRSGLDLGSNGSRGDVFVRDGERGGKLFHVHETIHEGQHQIDPNLQELGKIGLSEQEAKGIIASVHAELSKPFVRRG
jgi:hypothetical protein